MNREAGSKGGNPLRARKPRTNQKPPVHITPQQAAAVESLRQVDILQRDKGLTPRMYTPDRVLRAQPAQTNNKNILNPMKNSRDMVPPGRRQFLFKG